MSMSKVSYRLRCQLYGHEADVRSLSTITEFDGLVSASRDRTARIWRPVDEHSFEQRATFHDHKNYVIATCYIPPSDAFPDGLIATGSNDKTVCVYSPKQANHLFTLEGHEQTVSSLAHSTQTDLLLSGSWDCTARVWSLTKQTCVQTLIGHTKAVWSVIAMDDPAQRTRVILTASADQSILCWHNNAKIRSYQGHTGCVRSLVALNENEFLSSSNDCTIKRWNLVTSQCLQTYEGHTNFVYCLTRVLDNYFASVSEDRSLRLWSSGNSESIQTIRVPSTTVWTTCTLTNGDVAVGCSDGRIFIFTNDESRVANAQDLAAYESELATSTLQVKTGDLGEIKVDDLPGEEALQKPGKRDGATTMINRGGGRVEVYQWVQIDQRWIKIGDAVGSADSTAQGQASASGEKIMYEGKYYDYVFNVDLDDRQLKLPYNVNEDPWFAAQAFIHRHELNQIFLDQIAQFIIQNTKGMVIDQQASNYFDPFTGGGRYIPSSSTNSANSDAHQDPFTGGGRYVPTSDPRNNYNAYAQQKPTQSLSASQSAVTKTVGDTDVTLNFPQSTYTTMSNADASKILAKMKEFNAGLTGDGVRLSENQLDEIQNLLNGNVENLRDKINFLWQTLKWPEDKQFPTFDIIRLIVLNGDVCKYLLEDDNKTNEFFPLLLSYVPSAHAPNMMLIFRVFTNLFSNDLGEKYVLKNAHTIIPKLLIALPTSKKNAQIALTNIILNYCVYAYKKNDQNLSKYLYDFYQNMVDIQLESDGAKRLLLGLGTLFYTNADIVIDVRTTPDNSAKRFFTALEQQASQLNSDTLDCLEQCRKLPMNL